jgi:Icc protein
MHTRILHLTDLHLHADPEFCLLGINCRQSLLDVLAHVQAGRQVPELLLITGDLTHDETQQGYEQLKSILDPLQIPTYVLPGNHDIPHLMEQTLNSEWISNQQRILLDTWQIIMLNTRVENSEGGALEESEFTFLQQCLDDRPDKHVLVCMHHQPVPVGSTWLDTMQVQNSGRLLQMLVQYPQVKAVIWGHVHQVFSDQYEHIQLMSSPATCLQFLPGSHDFAIDTLRGPGYRWLTLTGAGELQTSVIWI